MATNKKITDLPNATLPVATGTKFEAVQGGVNVQVDAADMPGSGSGGSWGSITGTLSSQTDLQAALDAKQPLDSDLTAIAALTPANDDVLQRKAGAWTNRTLAQLGADLQTVNIGNLLYLYNNFV